jgi:signal transduction histidine kinase
MLAVLAGVILLGSLWVAVLRHRVEEKTETLRATLESTGDGILVMNSQRKVVTCNGKFVEICRIPQSLRHSTDAAAILRSASEQLKDPGGFLAKVHELYNDNETQSDDVLEFEDGRIVECHSEPQRVNGKSVGRAWGFRDVTERSHAREELEKARDAAEVASCAKTEFLAAMSHEIRTPMNAILGMSEMLAESSLDSEQTQYVDVFRRAGAKLLLLINDILALSKIEAGHFELDRVEFDLEEVVDQVIELTAFKAHAKGILLLSHLSPGIATFLIGDPTRLRQVLINLLGNAVKFTDSGEVVLTVRNPESGKPGQIEFGVSDTGIGIPPGKLETIFDDYSQADASTTRKYGGTGLGLGISQRIVEAMGGRITVTSSAGEGSTFRFTAQFEPAPETARKVRVPLGDLAGKRVLLIDDNSTNCLILREALQAWGLKSDAFRLPEEALAGLPEVMAGDQPYSLVIIDNR